MTDKITIAKNVEKLETEFLQAMRQSVLGFQAAGCLLVELINADPTARQRLTSVHKFPPRTLTRLERIGRKQVLPELSLGNDMLASLPISEQKQIMEGPIDAVIVQDGDLERTTHIKVNVLTAPKNLVRQIIGDGHIRSLSEQMAFLIDRANQRARKEKEEKPVDPSWYLSGRHAIIKGEKFSARQLEEIWKALRAANK